jgi:hypothetical protein
MTHRYLVARDCIACVAVLGLAIGNYVSFTHHASEVRSLDERFSRAHALAVSDGPAANKEILEVTLARLEASSRRVSQLGTLLSTAMLVLMLNLALGMFRRARQQGLAQCYAAARPEPVHSEGAGLSS